MEVFNELMPNNKKEAVKNALIEVAQHYKDIEFHGEHRLNEIQKNDLWKKEQALLHKYQYLEISYENFNNIETILAQRLSL